MREFDERPEVQQLFTHLKASLPALHELLREADSEVGGEDGVYRFYHQSLKVFSLQDVTVEIVSALQALAPNRVLNEWFSAIVKEGTGKTFTLADNERWLEVTRPIVEAFFHARHLLATAVRCGSELEAPPNLMPTGWATILYLYGLR